MGRKEITQGLRQDAVHLVLTEGRSGRQVCEMLGMGPTAARRWPASSRHPPEHEPTGQLLGQRIRRARLRHPEERVDPRRK